MSGAIFMQRRHAPAWGRAAHVGARAQLAVALALSILCHVLAIGLLRMSLTEKSAEYRPGPTLTVTVMTLPSMGAGPSAHDVRASSGQGSAGARSRKLPATANPTSSGSGTARGEPQPQAGQDAANDSAAFAEDVLPALDLGDALRRRAVRDVLASEIRDPREAAASPRPLSMQEQLGREIEQAALPSCTAPDATREVPIPLGGLFRLPLWAYAAIAGKCVP